MRQRPLLSFALLACAFSWLGWAPAVAASYGATQFAHPAFQLGYLLAALGPALAATVVTGRTEGRAGVRALYGRLIRWRVPGIWFAIALGLPIVLFAVAALIEGHGPERQSALDLAVPGAILAALVANLCLNVWEEIGWRGFALDRLQRAASPLVAACIVSLMWGVWHLPLFLMSSGGMAGAPYGIWLVGLLGASVLYAVVYNGGRGSLVPVTLFHAAINTVGAMLYTGGHAPVAAANLLAATAAVLWTRGRLCAPDMGAGDSPDPAEIAVGGATPRTLA